MVRYLIVNGTPTEKSLNKLYKFINTNFHNGDNDAIMTYHDDANYDKVVDYAVTVKNNPDRAEYNLLFNNCKTFASDAIDAGTPSWWE